MLKKFSVWIVLCLLAMLGSMVFLHWKTMRDFKETATRLQPLYQRQKVLDSLTLSLERYRRLSSGFRKLDVKEVGEIKDRLKASFALGVSGLDPLELNSEERAKAQKLRKQVDELLESSSRIEPMLYTQDAYQKPEVQEIHDRILAGISSLDQGTQMRISSLLLDSSKSDAQSVIVLIGISGGVFLLFLATWIRQYFVYVRPLKRLYGYATGIHPGMPAPEAPRLTGAHLAVVSVLQRLTTDIETYVRDRHKFILDVVNDLKNPLSLLQAGGRLLGMSKEQATESEAADELTQSLAAESVRRGLAIFSGSLEDLNDLADFNRLESRLEETTVDLSDLLSDVIRTLMGSDSGRRIQVSVPPIPVWVSVDARRIQRVLIQVLSKAMGTLSPQGGLSVIIHVTSQGVGGYRGVEITIQDTQRTQAGRNSAAGPEQDILKHWLSDTGLSMVLAHKIMKAHGGTLTAAGVLGTSVTLCLRLPQERMRNRGLISPPSENATQPGLLVQQAMARKEVQSRFN